MPKLATSYIDDGDTFVVLPNGVEGMIDEDKVKFTFNLAPTAEPSDSIELIDSFNDHIAHLQKIKQTVLFFGLQAVEVEQDFYWSDGDLLIKLRVAKTHNKLKHLNI